MRVTAKNVWHGWLHHTFDKSPVEAPLDKKSYELPHTPNLTGTLYAYRPKGSLAVQGERDRVTGDYDAWTPGG